MSSASGLSGGCSVSLSELLELFLLFDWIYGRRKEEVKAVRKEERMTMIKGSGMMEERRQGWLEEDNPGNQELAVRTRGQLEGRQHWLGQWEVLGKEEGGQRVEL